MGRGDGVARGRTQAARAYGDARVSPQRRSIAEAVDASREAFTIDRLADRVRDELPGVGTATVYRAVAAMLEAGRLERVGEHDGAALYARCDHDGHHHHLVCTSCGSTTAAPCPVGDGTRAAARAAGFDLTHHSVELYGLCAECRDDGAG